MAQLKRYNGTSWEIVGGVVTGDTLPIGSEVDYDGASAPAGWEQIDDDYVDISTQITKLRPSDLAIQSAYAKKMGKITILDIIFKSNTGFESGGGTEPIASLPNNLKPSQGIRSTCWVTADYSYPTWDGISSSGNGAIMGWLYITTAGQIYVRFPTVSGLTRKTVQIHITY